MNNIVKNLIFLVVLVVAFILCLNSIKSYKSESDASSQKRFLDYVYQNKCYISEMKEAYNGRVEKVWVCSQSKDDYGLDDGEDDEVDNI